MNGKSQASEKWIEIARVGRFRDSGGVWHDFGQARLEKIAAGYDPQRNQAPLVIGHPALDSPAHGWIEALKVENDRLLAKPAYVTEEIKRAVDNGLYKYVSMSLYPDNRLRHIGILGGAPPAIDGLAPISFSGKAALTIEFGGCSEPQPVAPETKGSQMTNEELTRQIADLQSKLAAVDQEKAAALAELAKAKAGAEKSAADFAAWREKQDKEILSARLDQLVKDGKVPPAEKEAVAKTAEALRQVGTMSFADSSENALETFLKALEARRPAELFQNFNAPAADAGGAATGKPLSAKL
jgi:phage I-like protein